MLKPSGKRKTFMVQVLNDQNGTLQGTVMNLDGKETTPFRSTLELVKLIDSTAGVVPVVEEEE